MSDHYDVIIIGTGAGGGTLLNKLASSGKRILVLERGPFLPREKENWDTKIAFNTTRYFGPEVWYDKNGGEVRAGMSCTRSSATLASRNWPMAKLNR
jgi:choline dehydrogenase-like flavoprotein